MNLSEGRLAFDSQKVSEDSEVTMDSLKLFGMTETGFTLLGTRRGKILLCLSNKHSLLAHKDVALS